MKTEIISQTGNPFLNREEILLKITEETMPTKEALIESLGKLKETIIIEDIKSSFGKNEFEAKVLIYKDEDSKNKYMTIPKKVREKMEAEKKQAEAAAKKAAAEESAAKEAEAAKIAEAETSLEGEAASKEPVKEKSEENKETPTEEKKE